jgi:hypothetical protein
MATPLQNNAAEIMKKPTLPLAAALAVAFASVSHGAILAQYNFTGGSAASSDTDLDTMAGSFTAPTGGVFDSTWDNVYALSNSTPASFTPSYYFSFTVTPTIDLALNLDTLSFDYAYNRTGGSSTGTLAANFVVQTNTDSFAANVATFSRNYGNVTGGSNFASTGNIDLSGAAYQNLTDPFEVRIYVYDNSGGSDKAVRLDNVVLNGTAVAIIPEPSGAMLFGAAGFLVLLRRRR